ncbi:MAG: rhomboid family intramembrane serine protease [Myxococcales bacterium FL481]|nr:MAG: rhomboid family intramembrane serine protease [Myxococcales bacterium FL481]
MPRFSPRAMGAAGQAGSRVETAAPPPARRSQSGWRSVTAALVGVCCVMFGLSVGQLGAAAAEFGWLWTGVPAQVLVDLGGLSVVEVWERAQWWRCATTVVLHGSAVHLGLNMLALWSVGGAVERAVGAVACCVVFGVSALAGCLVSLAWVDGWLVVGASGGVFGLAGALVVLRAWGTTEQRVALDRVDARALARWLALWLVAGGVLASLEVLPLAQGGHVGGVAAGLALGTLLGGRARGGAGLALVLAVVLGLTASFVWRDGALRPAARALALGYGELALDRPERATRHLALARELGGSSAGLDNDLAYALALSHQRLDWAAELADSALAAEPSNSDFLDTAGWVACLRGETETGLELLARAHESLALEGGDVSTIVSHSERCGLAEFPDGDGAGG